jgi:prephenate dehydrogenase
MSEEKKITIIGGSGSLGVWFAQWFIEHGFNVILHGRNKERLISAGNVTGAMITQDLESAVKDADIIMVSIPIKNTPEMLEKVSNYAKRDSLIFDVASIKGSVIPSTLEKIASNKKIMCASIHPMFGPGSEGLKDKTIIFAELPNGIDRESLKILKDIFTMDKKDLPVIKICKVDEHDKMMGLTLGLPHALNIIFLDILSKSGIPLEKISEFSGTTFRIQKILSESVIHQNPEIYSQIQMENHEFGSIFKLIIDSIGEYSNILNSNNFESFERLYRNLNEYSAPDIDYKDSYKKFYKFIKALKE